MLKRSALFAAVCAAALAVAAPASAGGFGHFGGHHFGGFHHGGFHHGFGGWGPGIALGVAAPIIAYGAYDVYDPPPVVRRCWISPWGVRHCRIYYY
jgi:hypothetical protein